nr:hypothetical protein [Tanacetum cinerariifolium]
MQMLLKKLEIVKLKARVKKLERLNKVKSSKLRCLKKVGTSQRIESSEDKENVFNQGRISVDIDERIELEMDQEKEAEIERRQADTQAEIYNIDLDHSSKVAAASTPISAVKPKVLKFTAAALAVSTRKRKGAAKRRKKQSEEAQRQSNEAQRMTEEAQEADALRGHLEIFPNKDDDVFVEAIPLAQKAPIVDYQVVVMDNKPKYKIIRADDTH